MPAGTIKFERMVEGDMIYLVTSSISQAWEQAEEFLCNGRSSFILEDNLVQLLCANNLTMVAHQSLCDGIDL